MFKMSYYCFETAKNHKNISPYSLPVHHHQSQHQHHQQHQFANNSNNNNQREQSFQMSKSEIVEQIISDTLTDAIQIKIKKHTTLPLHELITPSVNVRTIKNPRPQNSFVIYRRNVQAEIAKEKGTNAAGKLDYVSKYAADKWRKESQEVKELYGLLANCAKKVHDIMYPGYVYQPKRQATTNEPMIMVHEPSMNGVGYKLRPSSNNINSNNHNNPSNSTAGIPIDSTIMMNNAMNTMIPNNPNIPTPPETPLPSPPAQRPLRFNSSSSPPHYHHSPNHLLPSLLNHNINNNHHSQYYNHQYHNQIFNNNNNNNNNNNSNNMIPQQLPPLNHQYQQQFSSSSQSSTMSSSPSASSASSLISSNPSISLSLPLPIPNSSSPSPPPATQLSTSSSPPSISSTASSTKSSPLIYDHNNDNDSHNKMSFPLLPPPSVLDINLNVMSSYDRDMCKALDVYRKL